MIDIEFFFQEIANIPFYHTGITYFHIIGNINKSLKMNVVFCNASQGCMMNIFYALQCSYFSGYCRNVKPVRSICIIRI